MNATDGSCRLHFSRLRRGKPPLEEQEGCAAKNEVCRKQHILLFAKAKCLPLGNSNKFDCSRLLDILPKCKYILPARGIFSSRTFRDVRLPFAGQFLSAVPILKIGMNTPQRFTLQSYGE